MTKKENFLICDSMDYRGVHVDFYFDEPGQQVFTIWQDKEIGFGTFNTLYRDDMQFLIDEDLDTVKEFKDLVDKFPGIKFKYFDNANHRDIQLSKKGRILRVFFMDLDKEHTKSQILMATKKLAEEWLTANYRSF